MWDPGFGDVSMGADAAGGYDPEYDTELAGLGGVGGIDPVMHFGDSQRLAGTLRGGSPADAGDDAHSKRRHSDTLARASHLLDFGLGGNAFSREHSPSPVTHAHTAQKGGRGLVRRDSAPSAVQKYATMVRRDLPTGDSRTAAADST